MSMRNAIRNGRESFISKSHFSVGNRTRVKFSKDRWCGNSSLEESLSTLFSIANDKDSWVAKVWEQIGEEVNGVPTSLTTFMIGRSKE